MRKGRSTRITEAFWIGPFRIGASFGRSGVRGFLGVRTGRRASTSVSFPAGGRRKGRRS
jgi:hypothetical protein